MIQGIWGFQSVSRILSPPVRLGTPLFSEVVPERPSQSWSWNSQQYWGYVWIASVDIQPSCFRSVYLTTWLGDWSFTTTGWRATKEYLNHKGTKIRVSRVRFRAPFLPPFSLIFPPLFPLQALFTLPPLLSSSPPPLSPLFWLPENSDLGTPLI